MWLCDYNRNTYSIHLIHASPQSANHVAAEQTGATGLSVPEMADFPESSTQNIFHRKKRIQWAAILPGENRSWWEALDEVSQVGFGGRTQVKNSLFTTVVDWKECTVHHTLRQICYNSRGTSQVLSTRKRNLWLQWESCAVLCSEQSGHPFLRCRCIVALNVAPKVPMVLKVGVECLHCPNWCVGKQARITKAWTIGVDETEL